MNDTTQIVADYLTEEVIMDFVTEALLTEE